ncbi:hypothetical protein, partial [Nocardia sp. NPDC058497]|uniref:hypothetical protein n=1 Tax=Nocardia sp. NPDC058497 TaxID=3346529 RepID=UPI003650B404
TPLTETPADRANAYRRLGWHVVLDSHDQIILPADQVHAIQVSAGLADLVLDQLRRHKVITPIVDNAATGTRTFLTTAPKPDDTRAVTLFSRESSVQAIRTVPGCPIPLPTPDDDIRVWLDEPRPSRLADFELLARITVAAARTAGIAA